MLPLEYLFPLRAVGVTLRCTQAAQLHLFHQPALTAWLRHLVGEVEGYERFLTLDAPESGKLVYQAGERYRFTLVALAGGEGVLQWVLDQLRALPESVVVHDVQVPFRDNWVLEDVEDLFQRQSVERVEMLRPYTLKMLEQEAELWQGQGYCGVRWLSPVRLLLPVWQRQGQKGERRFCRHRSQLNFALLNNRLHDTLAELLRQRGVEVLPRLTDEALRMQAADVFWVDDAYYDAQGQAHPMGGMLGRLTLEMGDLPGEQWLYWVLGQYVGIGQRRVFGWGRYQLETLAGESTVVRSYAVTSLLTEASAEENLQTAYVALGGEEEAWPVERVMRLGERLLRQDYEVPALREQTVPRPEGGERLLQVSPFFDRVMQRAVAQVITPALDSMMYLGSFGFRRGRSRHQAAQMIQAAYQEGYRWVFESDIDDFFDQIHWARLWTRLTGFFREDPIVEAIMRWMSAPVERDNERVARQAGLPQGSPLSPLLANIMLDDFDRDVEQAGLRLIRFADDFVIVCRTQEEALAAAEVVTASLAEVGLTINPHKTMVRSFAQGFRYLGYLFLNSLALDVGGEKPPSVVSSPASPPVSQASPKETVMRVGEMDERGTVIFVSGAPAKVNSLKGHMQVKRVGQDTVLLSVPWRQVQSVVLIGPQHITTPALREAMQQGVSVHFADRGGHYQGCTWSGAKQDASLWLAQVAWLGDAEHALQAARSLVAARLRHQREVLRRRNVQRQLDETLKRLEQLARQSLQAIDVASLRGFEGQGAKDYFAALAVLSPSWVGFAGRQRRPPPDPLNALLSLGYTILAAHLDTVIRVGGLLPWVGLYHVPHGRHAVLVSDLMEPFRHLVERVALSSLNKKKLTEADFFVTDQQGCRLHDEARRRYLGLLSEQFETPFRGQGLPTAEKLVVHVDWQVRMLREWIRGHVAQFSAWQMY